MAALFQYIKGDKVIWMVVLILSLFSILAVYSSSGTLAYRYQGGNTVFYLLKHSKILLGGLFITFLVHKIRYTFFSRLSQILIYVAIPLLFLTLVRGVSAGDASRWLEIPGTGLTFQTSDFAKLALIMYIARQLSVRQDQIKDFKTTFLPIVVHILIVCGLILPANFSTAAVLFCTSLVLMFIGRVNLKYILLLVGAGIVALAFFIMLVFAFPNINNRVATWKARIDNFSNGNSEGNYQAEQAKIAIATGGIIGKGPGNSTQRDFLPQASSDFIYAIMIEEGGLFTGILVLFLYVVLLFRGTRIVRKSSKTYGGLLAIGLTFSLVFQAMINMAVAVNLFPVTGQPLPLISMGGTSIWFTSIAIGIILGVSREVEEEETETVSKMTA